ncbi:MAG TPA: translation elongation factor Ts [Acidimicrobiales bacterium]|nr:translation elongation factor Ts [Acidimicrobiales bacterium]
MASFTAKDVQALRRSTGVGMLDAKRALEESEGDMEKARLWLRERGKAQSARLADREASQGAVALAVTGRAAAIVELRCETDFVAKAESFVNLTDELAQLVAGRGEDAVAERADAIDDLRTTLKENINVGQVVRFETGADSVVGTYLHMQSGRGVNAVLVEMRGGSDELAHDVAVHVAFARPTYLRREDVPHEEVEAERATVERISRNEGKPEAALPKIVEGRMNGWFKERVLLDQPYARDEKRTIAEVVQGAEIVRFAQVVVGN